MNENALPLPMKKREAVIGWAWVFIHSFFLAFGLALIYFAVLEPMGVKLSDPQFNLIYYTLSFAMLLFSMFSFLRSSFRVLSEHVMETIFSVAVYYLVYMAAMTLLFVIVDSIPVEVVNENQEAVEAQTKVSPVIMVVVAVFLAPIVEEILFRGVVFGTIQKKSTVLAVIVSCLLFSLYHLWEFFLDGVSVGELLALLDYLPAGVLLCLCYRRSQNLYGPIFMHMLINTMSVIAQLGG